jgi:DNA replication protein DnaC
VRFLSTVELVNALELEKASGKAGQIAHRLMYADMVILDELGYLPFSSSAVHCDSICCPSSTCEQRGDHDQPKLQ